MMLAHKKLWESGIEYIKEAEEILKPLQAPYWGHQTSKEEFLTMREDMNPQLDGTGKPDTDTARFYPYHTLVEALAIIPNNGGWYQNQSASLPSGISLQFDTGSNTIYPPTYPNGIQIGDDVGNYGSQTTEWGFNINACGTINSGGRFANVYKQFVIC